MRQSQRYRFSRYPANIYFLVILTASVHFGCGQGLDTIDVTINGHELQLEVARTAEEQATGLMYRKKLPENRGMLFPYESDRKLSFWMKNTEIPLSIAFLAADGTIKEIYQMKPLSLSTVSSRQSVRFALEVNQGLFERLGIEVGDRVELPEDL